MGEKAECWVDVGLDRSPTRGEVCGGRREILWRAEVHVPMEGGGCHSGVSRIILQVHRLDRVQIGDLWFWRPRLVLAIEGVEISSIVM